MSKKDLGQVKRTKIKSGEYRITKAAVNLLPRSGLFYGEYKVGKSRFMASVIEVPHINKVLHVDIDGGASGTIAEEFPDVDIVEFKRGDIKGFEKFWQKLVDSDDSLGFDAVNLDTVSILQNWKAESLPKSMGYDKWEEVRVFTLKTMWELHDMPAVGYAAFHTQQANVLKGSEDKEYVKLTPAVQGAAKVSLGAIPDIIGFLHIEDPDGDDDERVLQLAPSENTNTGNRFKKLPKELYSPTMKRLYEIIREGV